MKKIILSLLILITFTGCSSNELKDNYEQMQISDDLTGYSAKVKISGLNSTTFTIRNYNNEEYEAVLENKDLEYNYFTREIEGDLTKSYYVIDDVIYEQKDNEYVESNIEKLYTDTNIYLKPLKSNKGIEKLEDKELGSNKYKVYEIEPKKSFIDDLFEYLDIDLKYEEATVNVLIDEEGYVYSIEYDIDNTNIYVFYSKLNSITPLEINNK